MFGRTFHDPVSARDSTCQILMSTTSLAAGDQTVTSYFTKMSHSTQSSGAKPGVWGGKRQAAGCGGEEVSFSEATVGVSDNSSRRSCPNLQQETQAAVTAVCVVSHSGFPGGVFW